MVNTPFDVGNAPFDVVIAPLMWEKLYDAILFLFVALQVVSDVPLSQVLVHVVGGVSGWGAVDHPP